jgi:hypothetical protein
VVAHSGGACLVIALFETGAQAREAMLAATIEADEESREGSIGMLASDDRGQPAVVAGGEPTGERPRIAGVLGMIASALLGGVMPARDRFFDARSDLTTDDVVRFGAELEAGHAAVAALAHRGRADRIVVFLTELGGKTELHRLSDQALRRAASGGAGSSPRPGVLRRSVRSVADPHQRAARRKT